VGAGVVLAILGLHVAGIVPIRALDQTLGLPTAATVAGPLGAYVVGLSFAFGWSPCIGPTLAAILTLAGTRESVAEGMGLLAVYGGAMAAPFLLAARFAERFHAVVHSSTRWLPIVRWSSAGLIVATGVGVMTGTFWYVGFWLLRAVPALEAFTR